MRRGIQSFCSACLLVLALAHLGSLQVLAQDDIADSISSQRYIVIDAETGEVFAEKDARDQVAIASLTKVFTTIEAIERAPLSTSITTTSDDLFSSASTTMGFGPGETFALRDLLYGMMLPSGNDAAHAIARALGAQPGDTSDQSVERFMGYVNERVRNMGLTDTTLLNPHGWGVPGHYSSAHDVAAFTMYALQYPTFVEVISTSQYNANGYLVTNTNRLLNGYSGLIGGKTGYDDDSGYCLVEIASRNGSTMISVTLDGIAPDIWYQDNAILLDYAFARKASRLAANQPIAGEVVSFRDPDAAVIAGMANAGASLGQVEAEPMTATPGPGAEPPTAPGVAGAADGTTSGSNSRDLSAWLVVAFVVAASVILRLARKATRRPVPAAEAAVSDDESTSDP